MTKPIHPKPLVQIEGASTRIRRTKRQMATDRQRAEIEALWREGQEIARARLATCTPAQIAKATKIVYAYDHQKPTRAQMAAMKALSRL